MAADLTDTGQLRELEARMEGAALELLVNNAEPDRFIEGESLEVTFGSCQFC